MKSDKGLPSPYAQLLASDLTGQTMQFPSTIAQGSILQCADEALDLFRTITSPNTGPNTGPNILQGTAGSALVTERARYLGLKNPSQISANGSCRIMCTSTGWIALNLAREDDWTLLPAWLRGKASNYDWDIIAELICNRTGAELVERGRLMGLPVAELNSCSGSHWYDVSIKGKFTDSQRPSPLVIDLSSLWAGPLCSHLLLQAGARVITVESVRRPDTTRDRSPEFHNLLNSGKKNVMLDLSDKTSVATLVKLLQKADIVIEGSRPRALRQLGIDAEKIVKQTPGLTWVGISGYGRKEPQANWVAFGDDAAVAAGAVDLVDGRPAFIGDALSDPLTGIHAAIAAWSGWQSNRSSLIDISLTGVTSFITRYVQGTFKNISATLQNIDLESPAPPRPATDIARPPGADTGEVLREFVKPCC
jgi:hypothetical protein